MSNQFIFVLSGKSDSEKLIRFFKIVGFLGGMVWLSRILIVIAIIGGILFLME
ncbi:MAG: hypothetical protein HND47_12605 [Chloroflexi bacterium]|nr:hypothetical protein [Chloroflexota bacterium]